MNLWIYYALYIWLALSPLLLYIAWRKGTGEKATFFFLTVSAVVLLLANSHGIRLALLGQDFTNRLHVTIALNGLLSVACGVYLATTRRFIAALAGAML